MHRLIRAAVLMAAIAIPVTLDGQETPATMYASILGDWESTVETPRGTITQTFTFSLDGDSLVGSVIGGVGRGGGDQATPLKNVKLENGTLSFEIERSFGGNSMVQMVTARVEGQGMSGTMTGGRRDREFAAIRKST